MRWKERILNQILLSKFWYIVPIYTIPKLIRREIEKTIQNFLWNKKQKIWSPRHLTQLAIWKRGLGFLVKDTQLNYLEIKWVQRLLNSSNALWKSLMLYWLNLKLNSNQGLALFRQEQILRSTRHKNLQNRKYNAK